MANTNNTNSGSDLDIKIGINIEDYKSVALKVNNMIKQLEKEMKIGIKVDFKNINKVNEDITKSKQEVLELSRGYKTLANEIKKMYKNQEGVFGVSVTEVSQAKRQVDSFTATITKNNGEVEKLAYSYNKAAKGFVLMKKEVTDVEALMTPKQKQKVDNTRYNYKTKFQDFNSQYPAEVLSNNKIKKQVDDIQLALKDLNKADLKLLDNEVTKIDNQFKRLKSDANILKKELSNSSSSKTQGKTSNTKKVEDENVQVLKLSQNYDKLLGQIKNIYKDSGEIKVVTEGDINNVKKFSVELERIKGLKEKINYSYNDDKKGFVVSDVKINNNSEAQTKKSLDAEKKLNDARIKLEQDTAKKLENVQREYYLKIAKLKREHGDELLKADNKAKLSELENQVNNLNKISTNDAQKAINDLGYSFKKFDEDVKAGASNNWADTFAKNTGKFISWYASANMVMQTKQFALDAVRTINQMDEAMVELNKVVDLSAGSMDKMKQSAVGMGKELGTSSIEVMNSMAEFGRITKDADKIRELSYVATLASNVTNLSADEAAKALNTTILSMKLNLTDSMDVLNQFNEIQNNYRTSAEDLAASIGEVGAIATQTGVELHQLNGYTTALVSSTGISGSEAGTAIKSFMSRTFRIGTEGADDAGKSEEMLNGLGIAVRDMSGNFREFDDILNDVNSKWDSLTNVQQTALAQQVGGTHHYSKFISLMENYGMAMEAANTALDSQDSALIENEKALDSVSGKWRQLMAGLDGVKLSFMQGDDIKNLLDLGVALTGITEKIGGFRLATTGMITLMVSQSKKVKEFSGLFDNLQDMWDYGELSLKNLGTKFKSFGTDVKTSVTSLKLFKRESTGVSTANKATTGSVNLLSFAWNKLTHSAIAAKIALAGLKIAASFGLSILIDGAITLASKLFNAKNELKDFNTELMNNLDTDNNTIAEAEKLLSKQQELNSALGNTKDVEKQNEIKKELLEVQKELAAILPESANGATEEGDAFSSNTAKIQENIDKKKEAMALDAAKYFDKNKKSLVDVDEYLKVTEEYEKMNEALINGTAWNNGKGYYDVQGSWVDQSDDIRVTTSMLSDAKKKYDEVNTSIQDQIKIYKTLENAKLSEAQINNILGKKEADNVRELIQLYNEKNQAELQGNNGITPPTTGNTLPDGLATSAVDAAKVYKEAVGAAQELKGIIDGINEAQGLTPDLVMQVIDTYPELGDKIGSVDELQAALNDKIQEQVQLQQDAYSIMIGDDVEFYQSKIANNAEYQAMVDEMLNTFINNGGEAYNIDLSNYQTLNELKNAIQNGFGQSIGTWLSNFVDTSASGYNIDLSNFKSLAEAKAAILSAINSEIAKVNRNMASTIAQYNAIVDKANVANGVDAVSGMGSQNSETGKLFGQLRGYANKIKELNWAIEQVNTSFDNFGAAFDGFNNAVVGGNMPDFSGVKPSGSGGRPSSGGGGSKKDPEAEAQKERERLEKEANSTIEKLRSDLINALKKKYEDLREKELEPLDKEIEMKQKELDRLRNGNMTEEEKLKAMKEELSLWQQNDSTLARQKIEELQKQIKEQELEMEIKNLEDKKDSVNKKYDDLLSEEKIYAEANNMIQKQNYDAMTSLLKEYGESWKEICVLMGKDVSEVIKAQIEELKNAYNYLKGNPSSGKPSGGSSGSSGGSSGGAITKGSRVKVSDVGSAIYYDSYGGSVGTWRGAGVSASEGLYVVNLNNGRAALSRTNNIGGALGWIDMSKIGRYKTGGNVGNWNSNDGRLAMVDSGERVLTAEQNKLFSNLIYDILPQIANIPLLTLTNLSKIYDMDKKNNDSPTSVEFNNNYNVVNKVPFDVKKHEMNMEQRFRKELLAAGIKTSN